MKPVAMFVLGAVLAAGLVLFITGGEDKPTAQPVAVQPVPAPAPAEAPEANPEAAAPAPAPSPVASRVVPEVAEPVRSSPRRPSPVPARRSEPAPRKATAPEPVFTAQSTPAAAAPTPAPQQSAPAPAPAEQVLEPGKPVVLPPPPPDPPRVAKTVTIPAGTLVTVRIDEALASDRNQQGDSFRATLDQPLVIDGFVIAERGSRVEGRVNEIDAGGRVRGVARMSLELVRMNTADGQRIKLQTESFAKTAESSRNKDIAKIGAAAGIGAAIGAIAGGGRGAAIGAAAGGAAGTGGVMATRGTPAQVPAETRLSFRLSQPITITEKL